MDNEIFNRISTLEQAGSKKEAHELLLELADENHPMALLELSSRYFSTEGYVNEVFPLEQNLELSEKLATQAKLELEALTKLGDGEAMRMLAYCYLGYHGHYYERNIQKAERLLLASYDAGCFFSANELASFYVGSDIEKAGYWYNLAETHNERVVYHPECESYLEKIHNKIKNYHSLRSFGRAKSARPF